MVNSERPNPWVNNLINRVFSRWLFSMEGVAKVMISIQGLVTWLK